MSYRKLAVFFTFILAFQVEVRVKASAGGVLSEPEHCEKSTVVCSLKATDTAFILKDGKNTWSLAPKSAVVRKSSQQLQFINGVLWVQKNSNQLSVETVYGQIEAFGGGFSVHKDGEKIYISNLDSDLSIKLRGQKTIQVPEGFNVWIGPVNDVGVSTVGTIQPVQLRSLLSKLAPSYRGGSNEFANVMKYYRDRWGDLAQKSAALYKELTERELASIAAEEAELKKQEIEKSLKKQKQKQQFYERTFSR